MAVRRQARPTASGQILVVVMDVGPGFSRRGPRLFFLWPGLFVLAGPAVQDHRGSVMVDFPHLELFYGVGRGGPVSYTHLTLPTNREV